eukprot:NODE_121_length_18880_cov_0.205687.p10 type:complete len:115 gc:universal NODE_121_length_18880_cov_0.205687:13993-14337(+)
MFLWSLLNAIKCDFYQNPASSRINIMFTPFFINKLLGSTIGIRSNCNGNVKSQNIYLNLKGQLISIPSCQNLWSIDIASNVNLGDWKACVNNGYQNSQVVLSVASDAEYAVASP